MSSKGTKALFLLGRTILGGYFLYSGIHHFQDRESMKQYAAAKKVPLPDAAVVGSGVTLIGGGGGSLILGIRPRLGLLAILTFLAGVSPIMHDFWKKEDANQRLQEMMNFTRNVAFAGAALALAGIEEWPLSIAAEESETKRLRSRPVRPFRTPPHCLKKNGTPMPRHWFRMETTQSRSILLAPGPLSPPTITQEIPARSILPKSSNRGSIERKRTATGASRR